MSPEKAEPVAVAIQATAPFPGAVKTRLAMMLGVDSAALLQERLIIRTVEVAAAAATGPLTLWVTPHEKHPCFENLAGRIPLAFRRQPAGDLGTRMLAAVTAAGGPVLVLGTDCPVLTAAHLTDSAEALRGGADVVVIGSGDGGYVVVGMRRPIPDLFAGMSWDTPDLMPETRRRAAQLGLSMREPAHLWGVDRPTDVRRLRREGLTDLLAGIDRETMPLR